MTDTAVYVGAIAALLTIPAGMMLAAFASYSRHAVAAGAALTVLGFVGLLAIGVYATAAGI